MARVTASSMISLDAYSRANDRPEHGLGEGGERLHYWFSVGTGRMAAATTVS